MVECPTPTNARIFGFAKRGHENPYAARANAPRSNSSHLWELSTIYQFPPRERPKRRNASKSLRRKGFGPFPTSGTIGNYWELSALLTRSPFPPLRGERVGNGNGTVKGTNELTQEATR